MYLLILQIVVLTFINCNARRTINLNYNFLDYMTEFGLKNRTAPFYHGFSCISLFLKPSEKSAQYVSTETTSDFSELSSKKIETVC